MDAPDVVELSDDIDDDAGTLNQLVLQKSGVGFDDAYQYLDWQNDEHREYMRTIQDLEKASEAIEAKIPRAARIVADGVLNDQTSQHIADRAGISRQQVSRWRADDKVKRIVSLLRRARRMIEAPPIAHRVQLAWRIALRNELENPKVSLAAIDLINKTTAAYAPEEKNNTAPTIVLGNFTINNNGHVEMGTPAIDGEATDVSIEAIEIDIE